MKDHGRMTSRERILAALRKEPVDRIPFVPLIDSYTLMDMPPEIIGGVTGPIMDLATQIEAARRLGCDVNARHVPVTEPLAGGAPHLQSMGRFGPPVEARAEFEQGQLTEIIETPVGTLTAAWRYTDKVGWIPHMVKPAVTDHEELKIFHYAVERLLMEPPAPAYDMFHEAEARIGEDGIAMVSIPNSPLMFLIEMAWGLENTYYMLHDHRAEVEDIMARLRTSVRRHVEAVAASPAQVVVQYENTSSTLLSPDMFLRYCLPCLNEHADILGAAGKIFLVHMCGKLRAFVNDIGRGRFDGVSDIPPPPTGDLALDEAADRLPEHSVMGGIDPTTFISRDAKAVEAEVAGLIERIKPRRGVLLGSADTTPRGTPVENFRLVRRLVETIGAYD
jgi:uroporphyrinogen-III decarboxylase